MNPRMLGWIAALAALGVSLGACGTSSSDSSSSSSPPPPGYTQFFTDDFTRADGAIGGNYLTYIPPPIAIGPPPPTFFLTSSLAIASNQVSLKGEAGAPLAIYNQIVPGTNHRISVDISFAGAFNSASANWLLLRSDLNANPQNSYQCGTTSGSSAANAVLKIGKTVAGVTSQLALGATDHPVGFPATYTLRFQAEGSSLACQLVNGSGTVLETLWATDASLTSGYAGFQGGDANGNLRLDHLGISYSDSSSSSPPPGPTHFFADDFTRADGAIGSNYLTYIPPAVPFPPNPGSAISIVSNRLAMDGHNGPPLALYNQIVPGTLQGIAVDLSFTGTFDSNGGIMLLLRSDFVSNQNPLNCYRCAMTVGSSSSNAVLKISKTVAGVTGQLALGTTNYPVGGGATYSLRFQADGSTLACQLLSISGTVLETRMATDASLTSGYAGFQGGDTNATLRFDHMGISYQ